MMNTRIIEATNRQLAATHPEHSVWVSANAGTGKTRVLTNRFLSLLLHDFSLRPDEILAITYTRAAAREMMNRIREELMQWATLPEEALKKKIEALIVSGDVTPQHMSRARQLFADVLDAPLGLNVFTIHAFCQKLLQRFPLEAGVTPSFSVVEGRDEQRLRYEALSETFQQLSVDDDAFYQFFTARVSEYSLRNACADFIDNPSRYRELFTKKGGLTGVLNDLADTLNLPWGFAPQDEQDYFLNEIFAQLERNKISECVSFLQKGKSGAQRNAQYLQNFMDTGDWSQAAKAFEDSKGDIRLPEKIADKTSLELGGDRLVKNLDDLSQAYVRADTNRRNMISYLKTASYLTIGAKALEVYEAKKASAGVLDFNDLVQRASYLLTNADNAAWVQYRLDTSIHHVLLDEGQDIDAEQWHLIEAIIREFYDGKGQYDAPRTFFAVGDLKQSIFRFRGAMPDVFGAIPSYLKNKNPEKSVEVGLTTSFRSSSAILQVTDQFLSEEHNRKAVGGQKAVRDHIAAFETLGGQVEFWPLVDAEKAEAESEPWTLPTYTKPDSTANALMAEKVADSIYNLLQSRDVLSASGKAISAGDILILLRSRGVMGDLIQALNAKGLPHTGADDFNLLDEPIVQDLLSVGRFLLASDDDLALAQVMKSPLFDISEDVLMRACTQKAKGQSLWSYVYDHHDVLGITYMKDTIRQLLAMTDFDSVHTLYSALIQKTQAKGRYLSRQGGAKSSTPLRVVADVIDTFLNAALAHHGDLTSFLHDFETYGLRLKRVQDDKDNAIRIMTVHSSKGLEAPIVYMPDTTADFYEKISKSQQTPVLWDDEQLCLYNVPKSEQTPLHQKLKDKERAETFGDEMRLLYVALTRAKERLYIGGVKKRNLENTWYNTLQTMVEIHEGWEDKNGVKVWRHQGKMVENASSPSQDEEVYELPTWAHGSVMRESQPQVIHASQNDEAEVSLQAGEEKLLFQRGRIMHRLLEHLPNLPAEEREIYAQTFLENLELEPAQQKTILQSVVGVFETYPELFAENSRAEVPVIAQTSESTIIEGIVDRLVMKQDEVWVIDYKTDARVPTEVPKHYQTQLKRYAKVMQCIYPQHKIKIGLLWTQAKDGANQQKPRLDWVS